MGFYIDGSSQEKVDFIQQHGKLIHSHCALDVFSRMPDYLPVVLVDNGAFMALAVAYCPEECRRFLLSEDDGRPKLWAAAPKEEIFKVAPDLRKYIKASH